MAPTYDYLCSKGHETEVSHNILDAALTKCPKKGCRAAAKRLISRTSFQLKGNGWFNNGYSGPSNQAPKSKNKNKISKKKQ